MIELNSKYAGKRRSDRSIGKFLFTQSAGVKVDITKIGIQRAEDIQLRRGNEFAQVMPAEGFETETKVKIDVIGRQSVISTALNVECNQIGSTLFSLAPVQIVFDIFAYERVDDLRTIGHETAHHGVQLCAGRFRKIEFDYEMQALR